MIKKEIPDIIFCGAIPAQTLARIELNPMTGKVYNAEDTWKMALDPQKWLITHNAKPVTKEGFQSWFYSQHPYGGKLENGYDRRNVSAYFPDITNPDFQELLLSWAKKQIDCGVDAIWIDMLYHQVNLLARLTGDLKHPAIKETFAAAVKIVEEIHKYGKLQGRHIYVGSWAGPFVVSEAMGRKLSYAPPEVDFITVTPNNQELENMQLNNKIWDKLIPAVKKIHGAIPVFAFMDWAFDMSQTVVFSQKLTAEEQREVLKTFDKSFGQMGVNFAYPVHGGYMGRGDITKKLSFGKFRIYDSLAPEFDTYKAIKELAVKKTRLSRYSDDKNVNRQ